MAGLALAFLLEYLDDSIKFPDEVERFTGLALLGVIPKIKTARTSVREQLTDNPRSTLAEAYRSLRTALQFSTAHGAPRTLVVTSCTKNEGKSTTSFATALALAHLGKRVLLVDGDMRNPSVHTFFNADHSAGLSNLLSSEVDPMTITRTSNVPNLFYMSAGPLPPNPAELLSGGQLAKLLAPAQSHFDHIVVDAPPVMGLADAVILCKQVDAALFVIESTSTRKTSIRNALKRLQQAGARPLGAVLTKLPSDASLYGYDAGYYYGSDPDSGKLSRA